MAKWLFQLMPVLSYGRCNRYGALRDSSITISWMASRHIYTHRYKKLKIPNFCQFQYCFGQLCKMYVHTLHSILWIFLGSRNTLTVVSFVKINIMSLQLCSSICGFCDFATKKGQNIDSKILSGPPQKMSDCHFNTQ